jgi:hypothetical protein
MSYAAYGGEDVVGDPIISIDPVSPSISSISPRVLTSGVSPSNGEILITGENLEFATATIDGTGLSISANFGQSNSTTISLSYSLANDAAPGPRTITVTATGGTASTVVHVLPKVTITSTVPGFGVGVGYEAMVRVDLSAASVAEPIILDINRASGTGNIQFSDGTTSKVITASTDLTMRGIDVSSLANNISLTARPQLVNNTTSAMASLTAITVDISLRSETGSTPSLDNDKRDTFLRLVMPLLGLNIATEAIERTQYCGIGVEFIGSISPKDFTGLVTLRRKIVSDATYKGSTLSEDSNPRSDDSFPELLDSDPQSGGSSGKVYDLDGPGIGIASNDPSTWRVRNNFVEYAVLGDRSSNYRASSDFKWYSSTSCAPDASGQPSFKFDVSNDNRIGTGVINTSWDLK